MIIEFAPVPAKSDNFVQFWKALGLIENEGISVSSSMKAILVKFAQLWKARPPIEMD
jgi:hypothetical protein